jgi:hypothetical protein
MSKRSLNTIALAGALAALAAGGCGSGDDGKPIPATVRQQLEVQLQETDNRLGNGTAGACQDITSDTEPDVDRILDRVPDDVDPDVRDALNEGFARLFKLVSSRCDELESERTESETVSTEEPPPPEEETTTTEEQTTPPETTETEEPPEQPTSPDTGTGNGNGSGGGDGDENQRGGVQTPGDVGGGATPPAP